MILLILQCHITNLRTIQSLLKDSKDTKNGDVGGRSEPHVFGNQIIDRNILGNVFNMLLCP